MDRETAGLMMRQDPERFFSEFLALQSMITDQSAMIEAQSQTISEQHKEIEALKERVAELEELKRLARAEKYTPSAEGMEQFFPEFEEILNGADEDKGGEEEAAPKPARAKKERKKRKPLSARAGSDVCDIDHTAGLPGSMEIGGVRYTLRKETVEKLSVVPARFIVERHHYPAWEADAEVAEGERRLVVMGSPETDGLSCSPALAARLVVSKFDDHIPLYRQEEILLRDGIRLTRQTMSFWLGRYGRLLEPLQEVFREELYSSACLYKDETPVQVLDVRTGSGKVARDSFMYVTVGSTYSGADGRFHDLVLVEHIRGRSRDTLLSDLDRYGYAGPVITDGLSGYRTIGVHGTCWVHALRGYKKILKANPRCEDAAEVCRLAAPIFSTDSSLREELLSGRIGREEFLSLRREASEPAIDAVLSFCDSISGKYAPSSAMGKAISYVQNRRDTLRTYLGYIEAEPSNNVCERVCKTFAVGRKNWMFFQCVESARYSSFYLSLIETAKRHGLSPLDYMEYVLTFAPECRDKDDWRSLLPWNADLSRLDPIREIRGNAAPDPSRTRPYILSGLTGQTVIMPERP